MSNNINESISERIIEALIEGDHITCEHDDHPGGEDYPGDHSVTYDVDKRGKEKVEAILAEATIPKQMLKQFSDELGKDTR